MVDTVSMVVGSAIGSVVTMLLINWRFFRHAIVFLVWRVRYPGLAKSHWARATMAAQARVNAEADLEAVVSSLRSIARTQTLQNAQRIARDTLKQRGL